MSQAEAPITAAGVTTLLGALRAGDQGAADRLLTLLYPELRRLAGRYLRRERGDHTLQPTALVNEAYLRIFSSAAVDWQDRAHFFAVVARQMRRILVDHARTVRSQKRGGDQLKVSVEVLHDLPARPDHDLVSVDEAVSALEQEDERSARVVELRFFGGLTEQEIGQVLGTSVATVKRDWTYARAWLWTYLSSQADPSGG